MIMDIRKFMQKFEFPGFCVEQRNKSHVSHLTIRQKPFSVTGKGKVRCTPEQMTVCNVIIRNASNDFDFSLRVDEAEIFMGHVIYSGAVRRDHRRGIPEHSLREVFDFRFFRIQTHIRKKTFPTRGKSCIKPEIFSIR